MKSKLNFDVVRRISFEFLHVTEALLSCRVITSYKKNCRTPLPSNSGCKNIFVLLLLMLLLLMLLLITGFLCTGDEILSVNGRCVQGLSHEEAIAEFRKVADRWLSLNSSFLTFNLANRWLCIYWSNLRKFGQQMALHSYCQTWKSWPKDGSALHSCYQT